MVRSLKSRKMCSNQWKRLQVSMSLYCMISALFVEACVNTIYAHG